MVKQNKEHDTHDTIVLSRAAQPWDAVTRRDFMRIAEVG